MHSAPLPPGTLLKSGQYRIERQIGRGGLGLVYLATDTRNSERYAIKETFDNNYAQRSVDGFTLVPRADVKQAKTIHEHQCKRAHEESQRFSTLKHPCLVRLLEAFNAHGTAYLVMPFIEGTPLHLAADWPEARKPQWVLTVLEQLADALDTLHQHQLIHRDLKPDNVMIRQSVQRDAPSPVLLDTGAARDYCDARVLHTQIATDFGAPEIVSASEAKRFGAPGPATDCFALAGIAYWLLSGDKPAPYAARVSELERSSGSGRDPLEHPANMNDAVWAVLKRSLSLKVADREASTVALVRTLKIALTEQVVAKPEIIAEPPVREDPIPPVKTSVSASVTPLDPQPAPGIETWVISIALTLALCLLLMTLLGMESGLIAVLCLLLLHLLVATLAIRCGLSPARALLPLLNVRALWQ